MSLWTITLALGYLAVIVLNLLLSFSSATALGMLLCVAVIFLPSPIFVAIGRLLPKKRFSIDKFPFRVGKIKKKVCEFTKVKRWKSKVPVAGRILSDISKPKDEGFLDLFIFESCFAEWLHSTLCYWAVIGCVIIALIDSSLFLPIALPFALLFIYQNMSSVIIQWFVRPRMVRYKDLLLERQARQQEDADLVQI